MDDRHVPGPRFVEEAIAEHSIKSLFVVQSQQKRHETLLSKAKAAGIRTKIVNEAEFKRRFGQLRHQGIVGIAPPYQYADASEIFHDDMPLVIALDQLSDPHNFGAIIRSAVAFDASIIVPQNRSVSVNATVARTSAGTVERAKIAQVTNLQRTLHQAAQRGMDVIGFAADGDLSLNELPPPSPEGRVLVIGAEGKGMRRMVKERCTWLAKIPYPGKAESLNASVAAGIALYAASLVHQKT